MLNGTVKAKLCKKIGYRNKKKRGIDPGRIVLEFLCEKYKISITPLNGLIRFSRILEDPGRPWIFRQEFAYRMSEWECIDSICDYIEEDIVDYGRSYYWPGFQILH